MSRSLIAKDFIKLKEYLARNSLLPRENIDSILKSLHKNLFSLFLWEERIKKTKEHKYIFLTDLRSDLCQTLPLVLQGYRKPVYLLLRSSIENLLKHIYYTDHKIEYLIYLNSDKYVPMEDLYDYCLLHPTTSKLSKALKLKNRLSDKYAQFSKKVHGKTVTKREFVESLSKLSFDKKLFLDYYKEVKHLAQLYNLTLIIFNSRTFQKMVAEERQVILDTLDNDNFKLYKKYKLH